MSRSLKKGPYINVKLEKKVLAMNESGKKVVVKTWARASMISPDSFMARILFSSLTLIYGPFFNERLIVYSINQITFFFSQ